LELAAASVELQHSAIVTMLRAYGYRRRIAPLVVPRPGASARLAPRPSDRVPLRGLIDELTRTR